MKKIIVFGATGNIGMYLIDYLLDNLDPFEYEVIAVGKRYFNKFYRNVEYIQLDITNDNEFLKLPKNDVYAVVHLAGILPAYYKDFNPNVYVDVNIKGSINILEYCRKNSIDRIVYTQTWSDLAGYWGKEIVLSPYMDRKLKYTGDHAFYSITKSMIMDTLEFYHEEYGLKTFVFRLPNVYLYSPQKFYYVNGEKKVISYRYIIDKAKKGEDIELWGNPDAFKDILYVKDLQEKIMLFLLILIYLNILSEKMNY